MPTYEFFCNNCNNNFEKWFSMKEEQKVACPSCGSDNVKKIFNIVSGILFKGKGFYCTDYKNKKEESCCSSSSNKDNSK